MENDKVNNLQIYPIRIKDNFEESMRDKYTSLQMSFLELCKAYDLSWFSTKFNVVVQNPKGVKTFRLHFWEKKMANFLHVLLSMRTSYSPSII